MSKIVTKQQINEEVSPNGLKITQAAQKETKKESDAYYKSVKDKVDSVYGNKGKSDVEPKKHNYSDEEKEYHDEMETLNGLEMTEYSSEPNDEFKDRARKAITGDSTMGNKIYTGEWNPETGEGNGNTEPVWNASRVELGDELLDRVEKSKKKRDEEALDYVALGDDMEMKSKPNKNKTLAFETTIKDMNYTHYAVVNGKIVEGLDLTSKTREDITLNLESLVLEPIKAVLKEEVSKSDVKVYTSRGLAKIGLNENNEGDWVQIKEEAKDDSTHYLIHKESNTVVESFNFKDFKKDEIMERVRKALRESFVDIKPTEIKIVSKNNALKEGIDLNSKYIIRESKIKRLKFKNTFNGFKKAETLIPESYKVDGKKFEMTDGNETYLVRWEGSLNEGVAVVLAEENKAVINESMNKMKYLMAFNGTSEESAKSKDRLFENEFFELNIQKAKKFINESKEKEKSLMTESVNVEKPIKDRFNAQKLVFDNIAESVAVLNKARYIVEGKSYEGIEYDITIKETELPTDVIMDRIVTENQHRKPSDRSISFKFYNENGDLLR